MIKIVFFDAGGTILEPYPTFAEAFTRICRTHGYEVEPADVQRVFHEQGPNVAEAARDAGVVNATTSAESSQIFWRHLYTMFLKSLGITDDELRDDLLTSCFPKFLGPSGSCGRRVTGWASSRISKDGSRRSWSRRRRETSLR
jgi:hypothetical protein